ncbi:DNA-binding response OmpR family regulator [Catenuloplanes nepalensis]|uniref:DNA-binding response OmpR family regulator n=1 Tax=Catenuloplanes nepalensis TaxID=587533 RepID=A0ABT9MWY4_9ACTN|nr:winged helix-turn-helix domain-containing protein [Catenuloplanes nepalensis]MDP9795753.1 DNA-binding response OmpR family regulator [Catenuloplanes nepalensis]
MSVIALAPRHQRTAAGPGRATTPGARRPAVTVTLSIPLGAGDNTRLLEVIRELAALGEGQVSVLDAGPIADLGGPVAEPELRVVADPTELTVWSGSRTAFIGREPLALTRLEFDLLHFFADNPRRVFSRIQLLSAVWGYEHAGVRTVDVHVRRLRMKLGTEVPLITTVYGVGYRLADDARVSIRTDG